ncbi:DNA polymerase IV, partial [Staphylococcus epidermidis]
MMIINYQNVHEILMNLDIGGFPGVGKATKAIMHEHGIYNGKDLYKKDERELIRIFGKRGHGLYEKARGRGTNIVKAHRIRKSV